MIGCLNILKSISLSKGLIEVLKMDWKRNKKIKKNLSMKVISMLIEADENTIMKKKDIIVNLWN